MKLAASLLIVVMGGAAAVGASLKPVDVASLFIAPDREASLIWRVEDGDLTNPISCRIRDLIGSLAASGEAQSHLVEPP